MLIVWLNGLVACTLVQVMYMTRVIARTSVQGTPVQVALVRLS